ncbi:xanthine dehydrogenase family protein molybdopterin-binding subunit [Lunatibacter salilacus]|uniref:xanthine dehydrogenase family protein molybdopterin-binding subunit n=1 Tax=Lunatibacter salilacus TaxID=2483804 RepID=UPI00131B972C|nr:molybdopterin cofactor-binding domain-containing protein [Lunatibacter salilacus]
MTKTKANPTLKAKSGISKSAVTNLSRRTFFKRMGVGVASCVMLSDIVMGEMLAADAADSLAAWIHVSDTGRITVFSGKAEVGQNIRTSLTQVLAEELFVSVDDIDLILSDTMRTPYDRGTTGSRTTPQMVPLLRRAAATVREILLETAAESWNLEKQSLDLERGTIAHPSNGKKLSYADLVSGKKLLRDVDSSAPLVPVEQWRIAGTSVPKINGRDFITGRHKYASDMTLPGMVYGKILRSPAVGAELIEIDTSEAERMPGVQVVKDGSFIGVTARDSSTAQVALALIQAKWRHSEQPSRSNLFEHLVSKSKNSPSPKNGVEKAFTQSSIQLEQEFLIDYIAHVPLEPRVGMAEWKGDKLTVWTGTQKPFGVQEDLSNEFGISKGNVRVIMPDTGSGYGGKHTAEAGVEAARLAKAVGKPVKVSWTREEEFKWAYLRPSGVIRVKCAGTDSGGLSSWEIYNFNSGGSGIESPYEVDTKHHQYISSDPPLRQGSYRALASTANTFAMESQMSDMADLLSMDSLDFRLKYLKNERLSNVLVAATEKFGWKRSKAPGSGYGLGCGTVKGGFVASCAEVEVDVATGEVSITRIVTAFECGAIINPRHLESQITGCVLQGLGGALFEAIEFEQGVVTNASLSSYRVPRFKDVPVIETVLVNRPDLPSAGSGETPIIGVAPAIRNAIADACGVKINRLPMLPDGRLPRV